MDAHATLLERARAALWGVAIGDAFGKMTEGYWPNQVELRYGGHLEEFHMPIPASPDRVGYWSYAEVTDDTTFTVLTAESIIENERVDEKDLVTRIAAKPIKGWPGWEQFDPQQALTGANTRTGNGAPMRSSPFGIINTTERLGKLCRDVYAGCRCTHNSQSAIGAACAMAACLSAVLEGMEKVSALRVASEAARMGEELGADDFLPHISRRIEWILNVYVPAGNSKRSGLNPGFAAWEGATYALYLFAKHDSAKDGIIDAANQGGDADSIASMTACLLAAYKPETLPVEWIDIVLKKNTIDMDTLSERLTKLRFKR
jgi:ADP-ribosylglycohydrolase